MSIIDISVKRPLLIIVAFTIVVLLGVFSYMSLNVNLTPKMDIPVLVITTVYPGAAATEVETSVTKKIEDAISSLENLKTITSKSQENFSMVSLELQTGANSDLAVQDAQRKINAIRSTLPDEVKEPSIMKFSLDDVPILKVGLTSNMNESDFYRLVDERIKENISKIQGVGQVSITGGVKREIQINVDPRKLKTYNLSIMQAINAVQTSNMDIPAGKVETIQNTYSIRLAAKFASIDEIENTKIASTPDGGTIRLKDIAEVRDGIADATTITRLNTKNSIGLQIVKQRDANTVVVCKSIKEELTKLEKEYAAENIKFTIASDASVYTNASIDSVIEDLILAIIIVSLVCFMFLHSVRNALIVMIAVPLSLVPAFIIMYLAGFTLNLISLMALSLVVGILVDDSIVVIENMYRYIEMGKSKVEAALLGCKQIMFTAAAITLVIVVVFLPLAIASGLVGQLLKEFAVPIIVSTMTSLLVSFTLTPMLVSKFGKHEDINGTTFANKLSRGFERGYNAIKDGYVNMLEKSFNKKILLFGLIALLFIGSIALLPMGFIGSSFMTNSDQGEFDITIEMAPQTALYQNNLQIAKIEEFLLKKPEVIRVFSNIGGTSNMLATTSANNKTQLTVKIIDKKERNITVEKYAQQIKEELNNFPGVKVNVAVASMMGSSNAPIQIVVRGDDQTKIQATAEMVKNITCNTPGTTDIKYSIDDPKQEIHIDLDRKKMDELGISVASAGATVRTAMAGNTDYKFTDKGYDYDINIVVDKFNKQSIDDIRSLNVVNSRGEQIEIQQFANVYQAMGPSALERYNRLSSITVNSYVVGRSTGTVGDEIKAQLKGKIPQGIEIEYAGMMQQQSEAFGTLFISLMVAILLVYLIMVALYDSFVYPFVVLFSIPLAIIGAILALAMTMNDLNIFSIVGIITLVGLVAKNAILLVDFTNQLRKEGRGLKEALLEAGKDRLRPILMTTIAMVFGMLPAAVAAGAGAEVKNGMAWVIIGGLLSSLVLTLFVVPNIYLIAENLMTRFKNRKHKGVSEPTLDLKAEN